MLAKTLEAFGAVEAEAAAAAAEAAAVAREVSETCSVGVGMAETGLWAWD